MSVSSLFRSVSNFLSVKERSIVTIVCLYKYGLFASIQIIVGMNSVEVEKSQLLFGVLEFW